MGGGVDDAKTARIRRRLPSCHQAGQKAYDDEGESRSAHTLTKGCKHKGYLRQNECSSVVRVLISTNWPLIVWTKSSLYFRRFLLWLKQCGGLSMLSFVA